MNIKKTLLTTLVTGTLVMASSLASANPGGFHGGPPRDFHGPSGPHGPGAHFNALPIGFNVVWIAGQKYYYHDHVYYKEAATGYVVVDTPTVSTSNSPMYIYPAAGQSAEQQRQDRYECHVWASDQTGYDPSNVSASTTTKLVYVEQPKTSQGNSVVTGAVGGAAVGALGGAIAGDAGIGAAVGAGIGAIAGAIKEDQEKQRAKAVPVTQTVTNNTASQDKANYERAMTACLEARNYNVK